MAIRDIITPQNPVLREKARKVTQFDDPKLQALVRNVLHHFGVEAREVGE